MTIACTKGTQKIELQDEKDMAKSLKSTSSGQQWSSQKIVKDYLLDKSVVSILKAQVDEVKSFIFLDDKNMIQAQLNSSIGYFIYQYENGSSNKVYRETGQIPETDEVSLNLPCNPHSYSLELLPGNRKNIIYRQTHSAYQESKRLNFNSIIGDDKKILECQQQGERKSRSKLGNVYSKEHQYEDGFVIVYKNKSEIGECLCEILESQRFDSQIESQQDSSKNGVKSVTVNINPGQNMIVKYIFTPTHQEYDFMTFLSELRQGCEGTEEVLAIRKENIRNVKKLEQKNYKVQNLKDGSKFFGPEVDKNQFKSGFGKWEGANGEVFIGHFLDDMMTGQGTLVSPDGDIYQGNFSNGCRNGQGKSYDRTGSKYDGEWVYDQMHGDGSLTFKDGSKYVG